MRHQDIPPRRPHHIVQRLSRNNTIMTRHWITARNMVERREQKIMHYVSINDNLFRNPLMIFKISQTGSSFPGCYKFN